MTCQFFNFPLPHSERCVTVIKYENPNNCQPSSNCLCGMHSGDLVLAVTKLGQDFIGVLAQ